jgi:hypothetical protein
LKLEEVLDIIINDTTDDAKNLKPEPEKKKDEESFTYTEYFCTSCTFKNDENPSEKCSICMSDAPESAKVLKVSEKQKAEIQKKQKDVEEARKQSEREEKLKLDHEKKMQVLTDNLLECQQYFDSAKVS